MRYHAGIAAVVLGLAAGARAAAPPPHFPLEPGNRWTYVDEWSGSGTTITVLALSGDAYWVDLGGRLVRIQGPPEALDIELPREGFVPYYRFQEETFVHRDLEECNDGD